MYKVRVQNFQTIVDATLTVKGFTVVTGNNNTGKSALMRAIRGVFTNPSPSFVRTGASHSTVDLWFGDDHIRWEKGTKTNRYTVNGEVFDKVGAGVVPQQVLDFGVGPIIAGGKEEWPQFAMQPLGVLFLLDKPGSAIADAVADVERIQKLNTALKMSEKDRRSSLSALKVRRKDAAKLAADRQRFDGLDLIVSRSALLSKKEAEAREVEKGCANLKDLHGRYEHVAQLSRFLAGVEDICVPCAESPSKVLKGLDMVRKFRTRRSEGLRLRGEVEAGIQAWGRVESQLSADDAVHLLGSRAQMQDLRVRLTRAQNQSSSLEEEIAQAEARALEAAREATEILGELGECPTCGHVM